MSLLVTEFLSVARIKGLRDGASSRHGVLNGKCVSFKTNDAEIALTVSAAQILENIKHSQGTLEHPVWVNGLLQLREFDIARAREDLKPAVIGGWSIVLEDIGLNIANLPEPAPSND